MDAFLRAAQAWTQVLNQAAHTALPNDLAEHIYQERGALLEPYLCVLARQRRIINTKVFFPRWAGVFFSSEHTDVVAHTSLPLFHPLMNLLTFHSLTRSPSYPLKKSGAWTRRVLSEPLLPP